MCHTGSCKHESYDGDCKVSGRLPDDCLLKDDDDEDSTKDDFYIGEDFYTMPNIAELSGLNRLQ